MTAYLELGASWLFANAKGHDAKVFAKSAPLAAFPEPTIRVASPAFGSGTVVKLGAEEPATMDVEYMATGQGRLPALEWDAEAVPEVAQWLLICEDVDAPLPTPICHSILLGIPKEKTSLSNDDLKLKDPSSTLLEGGFYYGKNLRGVVYVPPRPLLNHGMHRYFYDIVALKEPLDQAFIASKPSRDQVGAAINGKVLGWGRWVGQCERRYGQDA
jgi:phosphatidylethanolamine-binding protein (PEBP) family uncharacterized protein